ncbi:MAG: membrane protein insertase YidC [Candidatus Eisenbacteria bacterium]
MDERRAIVAVVLIFVVLFGFNYWQSTQRKQVAAEQAGTGVAGEVVESPTGGTIPAGDEGARGFTTVDTDVEEARDRDDVTVAPDPVQGVVPERTITVDTPLWVATLSNRGGSITSWRLKEYRERLDPEDDAPELVSLVSDGSRALALSMDYGPTTLAIDDWTFESTSPLRVDLTGGRESAVVRYSAVGPAGVAVTREYSFYADSYAFEARVEVSGLREPSGRRALWIGWPGLTPTEAKEDNKAPASVARIDGGITKDGLGRFKEQEEYLRVGAIEWVTTQSRYFMAAVAPEGFTCSETRAIGGTEPQNIGFKTAVSVEGQGTSVTFRVFAGPQDYELISAMGVGLERAIEMGWSFTRPLSVLLLKALVWGHKYLPNYGIVIILISIVTKLLFYRLTHKSFTEMKRMQDVQPKLKALKDQLGDNKEAMAKAQMELYKKEGVNPLGSCLPMILQMPVFIALFQVLRTTIELRGAPFMLWMTDLSQPDTIAAIAGFPIHVLPLLMGLGMLVQQKFTTSDPSQAAMTKMMPILFTVLFYNFAAGLVIYWLVNTILSIGQQYYIHRGPSAVVEVSPDAAAPEGVPETVPASVTATPKFEEAEVVDETGRTQFSSNGSAKRRRRRRKKK